MEKSNRSYDTGPGIKPSTLITYELNLLRQDMEILREDHENLKEDYSKMKLGFNRWRDRGFGMLIAMGVGITYWTFGVSSSITLIKWFLETGAK